MISFLRYYQNACAERTLNALHEVRKLDKENQENRLKENMKKRESEEQNKGQKKEQKKRKT